MRIRANFTRYPVAERPIVAEAICIGEPYVLLSFQLWKRPRSSCANVQIAAKYKRLSIPCWGVYFWPLGRLLVKNRVQHIAARVVPRLRLGVGADKREPGERRHLSQNRLEPR